MRWRLKRNPRLWVFLLFVSLFLFFFFWALHRHKAHLENIKTQEEKTEEPEKPKIPVVVGHYAGNSVDNIFSQDLTKLLNTNDFDPKPRAGRNGEPVIVPTKDLFKMKVLFQINRFNLMASDMIPLNRTLPDVRRKQCASRYKNPGTLPDTSVVIVFHNEAWSTLLRTVHSVINRSPKHLLKEIILVDDASKREFLEKPLEDHVKKLNVPTRILRSSDRVGLINARIIGAKNATGEVLTFLDAHCECTVGWLEPLLEAISKNRKCVVAPVIDIINDETFSYSRSFDLHWGAFNWDLNFRWLTLHGNFLTERRKNVIEPFRTPAMAGGLFSMNREYFFELGSYDDQMEIWGGENIEMSFRVWQCGGSLEIAPCSHVGHVFRKSSPHTFPGGMNEILSRNLARVALVWMDDWANFFFRYNEGSRKERDKLNVDSRLELRKKLGCKSFEWYLNNIWPEHFFPTDERFFGRIIHKPTGKCLMREIRTQSHTKQYSQETGLAAIELCVKQDLILGQTFVITQDGIVMTDESICLDVPPPELKRKPPKVKILTCSDNPSQKWSYNRHDQVLEHVVSGLCVFATNEQRNPVLLPCDDKSQRWTLQPVPWK